jgi:LmbE family N-acetylglucosaminyl deacetylase
MRTYESAAPRTAEEVFAGQRVVAIEAHHDDIAVMNSSAVLAALEFADTVDVATITDGKRTTKGDPFEIAAGIRDDEATKVFDAMDVPQDNRHSFGMRDGSLRRPREKATLQANLGELLVATEATLVITQGKRGYDHHAGHTGVRIGALLAARRLATPVQFLELNQWGRGEIVIPTDPEIKMALTALNASQFPMIPARDGQQLPPGYQEQFGFMLPPATQKELAPYAPLFAQETYDLGQVNANHATSRPVPVLAHASR